MAAGGSVGNLNVNLNVNTSGVSSGISQATAMLQNFGASIGGMLKNALSVSLGNYITELFKKLADTMESAIVMGVNYNRQIEQLSTSFEVLTGSAEKGTALLKELQAFGNVTPFQTKDLAAGANVLLGYSVPLEKIMGMTSMLGDLSQGNVAKFQSMSLAFGQIFANGKLQGGDLLQLINAEFNPLSVIAKQSGKTMGELRKDMEGGKIGVDQVIKAMITATSEGGQFFGMMEKQGKTFNGMLSTLQDKIESTLGLVTKQLTDNLKNMMGTLINFLDVIGSDTNLQRLKDDIITNVVPAFEQLGKTILAVLGFTSEMGDISTNIDSATQGVGNLAKSLSFVVLVLRNMFLIFKTLVEGFKVGMEMIAAGILSMGALLGGLGVLMINSFYGIMYSILGVIEGVGRAIDDSLKLIVDGFNNVAIGVKNALLGTTTEYKSFGSSIKGIKDAFGKDNGGFQLAGEAKNNLNKQMGEIKDVWSKGMGAMNAQMIPDMEAVNQTLSSLFTAPDLAGVDNFLKAVNSKPQAGAKNYDKSGLASGLMNSTKDGAGGTKGIKSIADGMKDVIDSFKKATEAIFKFGDAFEKVTYEKFSPQKLLNRTNKIFETLKGWASNLIKLEQLGVSAGVLDELRGMGIKGAGITAGLVKADNSTREKILGNLSNASAIGQMQGAIVVNHEHKGSIDVKGADGQKQTLEVAKIIGTEINANRGRYSQNPSPINTFK